MHIHLHNGAKLIFCPFSVPEEPNTTHVPVLYDVSNPLEPILSEITFEEVYFYILEGLYYATRIHNIKDDPSRPEEVDF